MLKGVPKEWMFAMSFEHFTDAEKVTMRREFVAIILTRLLLLVFCADLGVALLTLLVGQLIGNAVLVRCLPGQCITPIPSRSA